VLEQDSVSAAESHAPGYCAAIQEFADEVRTGVSSSEVKMIFEKTFVNPSGPYELKDIAATRQAIPDRIHGELHMKIKEWSKR